MNPSQQQTLNQAIKLLQSLQIGGQSSSGSTLSQDISIPQYDIQIQKFYSKGKQLEPQIQKLTDFFHKASQAMKKIMIYSQVCKKYSTVQQQKLKNIFINLSNQIQTILKKNVQFMDHCKAMKQILGATFWVFVPTPQFIVKGAVQGADFNALKFQKKKNQQHNQWWASVSNACKALQKFVVKQYPTGLNFMFNGEDKWEQIISGNTTTLIQTTQNKPVQQNQPVVANNQANQVSQPKVPKKQLIGLNWQFRNYKQTNLSLSTQIQMKHGIFVQNCSSCQISIPSKFKSLNINKCSDLTLVIKSCVSGIQLMNSKNITIIVQEKTPSISVDKSQRVKLTLNQNNLDTDIVSCKASELNVSYGNNKGQQSKAHLISDQLITRWNPQTKKFETKIYDKFL